MKKSLYFCLPGYLKAQLWRSYDYGWHGLLVLQRGKPQTEKTPKCQANAWEEEVSSQLDRGPGGGALAVLELRVQRVGFRI